MASRISAGAARPATTFASRPTRISMTERRGASPARDADNSAGCVLGDIPICAARGDAGPVAATREWKDVLDYPCGRNPRSGSIGPQELARLRDLRYGEREA